ncbi:MULTISPECIES: DUF6542 domain-containing protein [Streptomycetaceae]|uniref:DUF6542 domain-containing protein n=1 Tax=Streptantibioticus cattleyicolor (strain ATCC 35852 / DSM 46488 / JCM 4925 / NBRC 14057 / NRRL 8057) TaxID=1003195 RepID=G8X421_STREN|nr:MULTISPECIES: hypothetical protein [Streptomycetaceae]AEW98015.1 hypothetical protein SCATT_56440 [Streptantibioticus cattleyicolor NRRL 8057 = DSM 46488]MYS62414.1 hypothetical protein [Streptomyces sp. SID5468]
MTGQRADATGEETEWWPKEAAPAGVTVGVPEPRESDRPARPSAPAARQGARTRTARTAPLVLALPPAGAVADLVLGHRIGWGLAGAMALAALLAAVAARRPATWVLLAAPPLVAAVLTAVAEVAGGATPLHTGVRLTTAAVRWGVDAFPAMALAEMVVAAVLVARGIGRAARRGRHR